MIYVIKIGGSLLYNDDGSVKVGALKILKSRISKEFKGKIIYVLGCGDLVHKLTNKYRINDGTAPIALRLSGFWQIKRLLDKRFAHMSEEMNVEYLDPMLLFMKASEGNKQSPEIVQFNKNFLKSEKSVLTSGGCVLDAAIRLCTISSDNVAAYLARELNVSELILFTNTDGVLERNGSTVRKIKISEYKSKDYIVGGMRDKLRRVSYAVSGGIKTYIVNGSTPKRDKLIRKNKFTRVVK